MKDIIIPAITMDLPLIYGLFEKAIEYQQANQYIGWKSYDTNYLQADVAQGLLYKIIRDGQIFGIFTTCYSDALIWREREQGDAIYLHRIVLNRAFAGQKIFPVILDWAIDHARRREFRFVRMDTWAENTKLIDYYRSYGFRFVENYRTNDTVDLPEQHRNLSIALLELEV